MSTLLVNAEASPGSIDQANPTVFPGGAYTGNKNWNGSTDYRKRLLVRFSLASLPVGSTITAAKIVLGVSGVACTIDGCPAMHGQKIEAFRTKRPWVYDPANDSPTWNRYAPGVGNEWSEPGAGHADDVAGWPDDPIGPPQNGPEPLQPDYELLLYGDLDPDGTGYASFLLKLEDETTAFTDHEDEYTVQWDNTNVKLEIAYTPAPPGPYPPCPRARWRFDACPGCVLCGPKPESCPCEHYLNGDAPCCFAATFSGFTGTYKSKLNKEWHLKYVSACRWTAQFCNPDNNTAETIELVLAEQSGPSYKWTLTFGSLATFEKEIGETKPSLSDSFVGGWTRTSGSEGDCDSLEPRSSVSCVQPSALCDHCRCKLAPEQILVEISGITNGFCLNCESLNGMYILTRFAPTESHNCGWFYETDIYIYPAWHDKCATEQQPHRMILKAQLDIGGDLLSLTFLDPQEDYPKPPYMRWIAWLPDKFCLLWDKQPLVAHSHYESCNNASSSALITALT